MIRDVILPQLAMGMSEGTIVEWAVAEGAHVDRDAPFASIETEKVVNELPSPYRGFVHLCVEVGEAVPVETVIARIAETESEYRELVGSGSPQVAATSRITTAEPFAAATAAMAEAPARPPASAAATAEPDAAASGMIAAVAAPAPGRAGRVRATGLARRIAREHGLDLRSLTGSGPGGRIVRQDVLAALERKQATATATAPAPAAAPTAGTTAAPAMREKARVPLTGMRKTIADRMIRSKTTAAHTYAFFEVDVTNLVRVRNTMLDREKELGGRISMVSLHVKALSIACQQVPICNSTLTNDEVVVWDNVNVGIAVATPGRTEYESGLHVPVIRNVERQGVVEIDRRVRDLTERARNGRLSSAEMTDGTITLSSTAGFMPGQWSVSTPLINQPQVVNFQPGSPIQKPVVVDGEIVVRTMLPCGLSYDHRAMDGEPVGRFIRKLSDLLAHPELMLL